MTREEPKDSIGQWVEGKEIVVDEDLLVYGCGRDMCGANTNLDSTVGSYIEKLDKANKEGRDQDDEEGEEENRD
jgi:hypothetical protein